MTKIDRHYALQGFHSQTFLLPKLVGEHDCSFAANVTSLMKDSAD